MCVFKAARQAAISAGMKWRMIRLELASSWRFPRGSAGRSYLMRLPLTDEGAIDPAALDAQPARATVRRYWPNEADLVGHLIRSGAGFAIQYEATGFAPAGGWPRAGTPGNGELFEFDAGTIRLGEEIRLTEPDGNQVRYRVASLQ